MKRLAQIAKQFRRKTEEITKAHLIEPVENLKKGKSMSKI